MAVATPVVGYVVQAANAFLSGGSFTIVWSEMGKLALAGAIGYLAKQFLTNSQGQLLTAEPN